MDQLLIETEVEESYAKYTYLGTSDNLYLILKKYENLDPQHTSVTINSNTEIIASGAFDPPTGQSYTTLFSLTLNKKLKKIQKDVFKHCKITTNLQYLGTVDEWASIEFENYYANPLSVKQGTCQIINFGSDIQINAQVIQSFTFVCYRFQKLTLKANVKEVKNGAFLNCSFTQGGMVRTPNILNWGQIKFESKYSNPVYYSKNLCNTSDTPFTTVLINSDISDYAFINDLSITTVNINNNADINYVGRDAFSGCSNLNISRDGMGKYLGATNKILIGVDEAVNTLMTGNYQAVAVDIQTKHEGYLDTNKTILGNYNGELANTTKFILNNAFYDCNLTEITIPNTVVYIGSEAFKNSAELINIVIPDSVKYIGPRCFEDCKSLKSITFGSGITEIPANICSSCDELETTTIPNTVTKIDTGAFNNCIKLKRIVIDPSNSQLAYIGDRAFLQCRSLGIVEDIDADDFNNNKVMIPATVKYIGEQAFYDCNNLRKIEVYFDKDTVVKEDSFACCFNIVEVYAPNLGAESVDDSAALLLGSPTLGYLGYYAAEVVLDSQDKDKGVLKKTDSDFIIYGQSDGNGGIDYDTSSVVAYEGTETDIEIPEVTRIKPYAFYNQKELIKISLSDTTNRLKSVGTSAFEKCDKLQLTEDGQGLRYIGSRNSPYMILVSTNPERKDINSVDINEYTKFICQSALSNYTALQTITTSCSSDKNISEGISKKEYAVPFSNIFGKNLVDTDHNIVSTLKFYADNGEIYSSNYYIPSDIRKITIKNDSIIPDGSFLKYTNLTEVVFDSSLTRVGSGAFDNCKKLTTISITNSNDLTSIGTGAFNNCIKLTSNFMLPKLAKIGASAFYNCELISNIDTHGNGISNTYITKLPENVFYNCVKLESDFVLPNLANIGARAFYNCEKIEVININTDHNGVNKNTLITTLPDQVFYNCQKLESDFYLDNLTTVGSGVFNNCSEITSLKLDGTFMTLEAGAFYGCGKLETLLLPFVGTQRSSSTASANTLFGVIFGSTSYIGALSPTTQAWSDSQTADYYIPTSLKYVNIAGANSIMLYGAFSNCQNIQEITIAGVHTVIRKKTFYHCSNLTSIDISNYNLENIEEQAFAECPLLTSQFTLSNVTTLGARVFYNCSSLITVTLNSQKISVIPAEAFYGCSNLTSSFNLNMTSIGEGAFDGCAKIPSATISSTITTINPRIFKNCGLLASSFNLPNITSIGESAFEGCSEIVGMEIGNTTTHLNNNITQLPNKVFYNCSKMVAAFNLPNLTNVGSDVFYNCSEITSVKLDGTFTTLAEGIFYGCGKLTTLLLPFVGGNKNEQSASRSTLFGYIFGTNNYTGSSPVTQVYYDGGSSTSVYSETYYIPDSLTQIEITRALKIYYGAFYDCIHIQNLILSSSTLTYIWGSCVSGCYGLTNITIPFIGADQTSSGRYFMHIFGGRQYSESYKVTLSGFNYYLPLSLTNITVLGGDITSHAFQGCSHVTHITINGDATTVSNAAFAYCTGLTNIVLPSTITIFGQQAFYQTAALTSLSILSNITSFGDMCFTASGLTNVTLNNSVVSLPYGIFENCAGLTSITLPNSITTVGTGVFRGCSNLTTAILSNNLTNIGEEMFANCSNLNNINIPNSVIQIGTRAFKNCTHFTSLTIPTSVTTILGSVLNGCSGLRTLTIPYVGNSVNPTQASENTLFGYLFGTDEYQGGTLTYQYYSSTGSRGYYIPNNLRSVTVSGGKLMYGAFYGCSILNTIKVKGSVPAVGDCAFYNCSGVRSCTLPNTITTVGNNAFYGCNRVDSLILPSIQSIGDSAFKNCTSLHAMNDDFAVAIPSTVTSIGSEAFNNCPEIYSITLPFVGKSATTSTASEQLFGYIFGSTQYTGGTIITQQGSDGNSYSACLPDDLHTVTITGTTVPAYGFYGCSTISSFNISNVTSIGEHAFQNCNNILFQTISIGNTNISTSLGVYAFKGCSYLQSVTIYSTLVEPGASNTAALGSGLFESTNLRSLSLRQTSRRASIQFRSNIFVNSTTTGVAVSVPSTLLSTYQNDSGWSSYTTYASVTGFTQVTLSSLS